MEEHLDVSDRKYEQLISQEDEEDSEKNRKEVNVLDDPVESRRLVGKN